MPQNTRLFAADQRVYTPRGNGVIVFIDYNPRTCTMCRDILCQRFDVRLDDDTTAIHRGCELATPLDHDGQTITAQAGAVLVAVQRIRTGAYRLSIRHSSTGSEVDELSRSFHSEHIARKAARTAAVLFRSGVTIQQALDLLAVFNVSAP